MRLKGAGTVGVTNASRCCNGDVILLDQLNQKWYISGSTTLLADAARIAHLNRVTPNATNDSHLSPATTDYTNDYIECG